MTAGEQAYALLTEAREAIGVAAAAWEGGSLPQVDGTPACLEDAAARLETAIELLRREPAGDPATSAQAHAVRADYERLLRVVDTRAAFYRKLGIRLGMPHGGEPAAAAGGSCRMEA
jgi:hypothetical protein